MKVTYYENLPLDGAGTMLHPAYKWLRVERTEFCDHITKAGNLYYMMKGGYVYHSIDVEKIRAIEDCGKSYGSFGEWHKDRFGN